MWLSLQGRSPPLAAPDLQPGVHAPAAGPAPPHTELHEPPAGTHHISRHLAVRLDIPVRVALKCAQCQSAWPDTYRYVPLAVTIEAAALASVIDIVAAADGTLCALSPLVLGSIS